jgi:hypothetical protein
MAVAPVLAHGSEFVPVHQLGDVRSAVPDQAGDVLDSQLGSDPLLQIQPIAGT